MRLLYRHILTFTSIAIILANPAAAQSVDQKATAQKSEPSEKDLQVHAMIEKLASPSFSERQKATKDLLNLGPDSVTLIETAAASSSGERQARLRMILPQLRKRLFDDQLDAFIARPSVEIAQRLPQWDRFESLCGNDHEALVIFGQILSAERRLFAARLFSPGDVSPMLEVRSAQIAKECNGRVDDEFPVAEVAAVMMLGSESETRLRRATSTNISSALDDPRFSQLIRDGVHAKVLRSIAEAWIVRPGIAAERPLLFSMQHDLKSARTVALRIIESNSNRPDMILSLLYLADLKSTEDLALIESLLEKETILWPQRGQIVQKLNPGDPPFDTNYNVQTRDVALVVAAHLRNISPDDIGMKVRPSDVTLYAVDSVGFNSAEARAKAVAAYRMLAKE